MRGVVLIAVGDDSYLKWAFNMAASLKHYCNLPIQLISAKDPGNHFFDYVTIVDKAAYTGENGELFPAKLKTSFYDLIEFDEAIYLDVDGVILKDITPLFDIKGDFITEIQGVYDTSQGSEFYHMKWAKPAVVYEHFGLPHDAKLPAINSSFMVIRKSDLCKELFTRAHDLVMNHALPYEKQWFTWGKPRGHKINQPDELYFNVALAQMNTVPVHARPIYFRMVSDSGENLTLDVIRANYYGIGLYGDSRTNHITTKEAYNREVVAVCREMNVPHHGKAEILGLTKFVTS